MYYLHLIPLFCSGPWVLLPMPCGGSGPIYILYEGCMSGICACGGGLVVEVAGLVVELCPARGYGSSRGAFRRPRAP